MRGDASSAKKDVHDVMRLLSNVVRGRDERSEPMDMSVEDITPVLEWYVSHLARLQLRIRDRESRRM